LERLELFLYRKASGIVSVTQSFRRKLIERGVDADKIAVVTNGVDMARFRPMDKDAELTCRYGLEGKFVAGYIGTHGLAHGLDTLLDAADRLRRAPGGERLRFILLGDGARKAALKERAQELGLDNLIFIDSVPKEEVPRYWSLLDVSIIHLRKTELFTTVIPSKLFECMGMGIPVLHGVGGESAEIVKREGVGVVFESENVDALCEALVRVERDSALYERLRARCLAAAGNHDRSEKAARMLEMLEQLRTLGRFTGSPEQVVD
jgi:glycosyltransferase involved in cell wall biosynthesis